MKKILFAALALCLFVFNPAMADDLSSAKSGGMVGEMANGYLGIVTPSPSPEIRSLVGSVNKLRRAEYDKIAKQNKQALSVVEKLAGQKTYEMTVAGNYVQDASGKWVRK